MALTRSAFRVNHLLPALSPREKLAREAVMGGGLQLLTGAERLLWEASERVLRQPAGKAALVLHLSRLAAPAPRPHHIRVASVLLQDSAQRFGGQVFCLRNRDLVLLGPTGGPQHAGQALAPENLPATLARLFAADVPDASQLTSLWYLEQDAAAMMAYLSACASVPAAAPSQAAEATGLHGLEGLFAHPLRAQMMVRQTAMALGVERRANPARGPYGSRRLVPLFQEFSLPPEAVTAPGQLAQLQNDPYLMRHFAAALDARVIQLWLDDFESRGALTRAVLASNLPVHIELGPPAILTESFARLAQRARDAGIRLDVAVPLVGLCAEQPMMAQACRVLEAQGCRLCVTRIDPLALGLLRVDQLNPDFIRLDWSPFLAVAWAGAGGGAETPEARVGRALARIDPSRVVLAGTQTSEALAWGQSRGIGIFQGPYLDQFQAATRMATCHSASACTVRQCSARGASLGLPGRAGCANPALLDAGPPAP